MPKKVVPDVASRENLKRQKLRTWWSAEPPGPITHHHAGDIVCSDAVQCLSAIRDETADIVFLDPPFNLGKIYGKAGPAADRLDDNKYGAFMEEVLEHSARVLKPGGSLYLYHIPRAAIRFARVLEARLTFRHWIAVSMKNGFVRGRGLYPAHYALLHYSKGVPAVLNRPKINPPTCPHCDEYIKDYGGYRVHIEGGVNLSDFWDDLSPVRHKKYKLRSANELPLALPRRIVEISGRRGGILVDPFAGTGTAIVAARLKKMKFIANDAEEANCALIVQRLSSIAERKNKVGNEP